MEFGSHYLGKNFLKHLDDDAGVKMAALQLRPYLTLQTHFRGGRKGLTEKAFLSVYRLAPAVYVPQKWRQKGT